ncbi:MAG: hypothetical protein PWP15_1121 [Methanothermococcus sp.]|nr:hypothetical protein [Methanothermococcus sp.]
MYEIDFFHFEELAELFDIPSGKYKKEMELITKTLSVRR